MKQQHVDDLSKSVMITDRIVWVGRVLPDDDFQCHAYLILNGNQSVLIDPGSIVTIEVTKQKIQEHISSELPEVQVRIGVHTGEVVRREGKHPFGRAVVMASRLLSEAKGGQILASDVSRQIASGGKFMFRKVGVFIPKGFDEEMTIYEIEWNQ